MYGFFDLSVINLLSLSITFFWSQLKLWSASQQYLAISFLSQSQFLTDLLGSSERDFKDPHKERKALKQLQADTSIVILPADKDRPTVILNREDYLEKCMDHINNGPYQLLK